MVVDSKKDLPAKYFSHLDRYKTDDLMKRILLGESSFRKEIEMFYDIIISTSISGSDYANKPNIQKSRTTPTTLLNILEPFCENSAFNHSLLDYDSVRIEAKNENRESGYYFFGMSLLCIGPVAGGAYYAKDLMTGFYIGMAAGIMGLTSAIKMIFDVCRRRKTPQFKEYKNLSVAIINADHCIKNYGTHLLLSALV